MLSLSALHIQESFFLLMTQEFLLGFVAEISVALLCSEADQGLCCY